MIQNLHPYDILALGQVTRWHTLRTARPQTLAEHKGRGALLAVWLGHRLPSGHFGAMDELEVLRLFLLHDIPETQNGDMPNPSKQALNRAYAEDYDALVEGVFWGSRGVASPMLTASGLGLMLVRVADILEAACFYWMEGLTERRPGQEPLKWLITKEALALTEELCPELNDAVAEVLRAAGVPDSALERMRMELVA
jgi:5'-deoxynucleotidase